LIRRSNSNWGGKITIFDFFQFNIEFIEGAGDGEWNAVSINNSGLIGGHVKVTDSEKYAYYWANTSSDPVALDLPDGYTYSELYSINGMGEMVGVMWETLDAQHAFYVDKDKNVFELEELLIDPLDEWQLTFARDINDLSEIVGFGSYNGESRGYLLTVTPEPLSCILFPIGLGVLGVFKRKFFR